MPPAQTTPMLSPVADRILVFRPDRNTDEEDYTKVFRPESERFARLYGVPPENVVEVDVGLALQDRKQAVLEAICRLPEIRAVVFACHGWKDGFQLGFRSSTVRILAAALKDRAAPDLAVVLYACGTGDGEDPDGAGPAPGGEGGCADAIRDALVAIGLRGAHVDGHSCVGHSTRNPYLRRFLGAESIGGAWIIEPDMAVERAWARLRKRLGSGDRITPAALLEDVGGSYGAGETWARWRFALRDTDLRFRFPFLSVDQIRAELAAAP